MTPVTSADPQAGSLADQPGSLGTVAALILVVGPMLSMIDSAVVNVAIPAIAGSLHSSLSQVQWSISGYLLALATGQSAVAWLDRRWGTERAYMASLAAFAVTSLGCALASTVGALIAFRIVQGLAGAPLVPLALSMILGPGRATDRMPVSAGLMFFAAPALGPVVGGLLVSGPGWRSIFLINPPLAAAGLAGLARMRPAGLGSEPDRTARIDVIGMSLLAAGLGLAARGAARGWGGSGAAAVDGV